MPEFDDSALLHADPNYDPAKAREYYLRTRQLKGRKKGIASVTSNANLADRAINGPRAGATKVPAKKGGPKKLSAAGKRRLRAKAEARLDALQARLDQLNDLLAQLVKAAKERSGVDTEEKKTAADKAKDSKDAKGTDPKSAAQKKKDAEAAAKKYAEENGSTAAKAKALEAKIAAVQDKIETARIKAAAELGVKTKSKTKKAT